MVTRNMNIGGDETVTEVRGSYQRHVAIKANREAVSEKPVFLDTWGQEQVKVFSYNVR